MTPGQQKLVDELREVDPDAAAHYTAIILFDMARNISTTSINLWAAFHCGHRAHRGGHTGMKSM